MRTPLASLTLFAIASAVACTPPTLTPTVDPASSGNARSAAAPIPLPDVTLEQCGPAPAAGTIYLEGQVTKRPTLVHPGPVRYPEQLHAARASGRVKLAFVIDPAGKPVESSLRTLEASDPGFVDISRATVLGSTFTPAMLDGHPVPVCTAQAINYSGL